MTAFPEPATTGDLRGLLLDCLDFYRSTVVAKLRGLDATDLTTARVPSGWSPSGMVGHLVHMERRWIQWGFLALQVDDPWGDADGTGWTTLPGDLDDLSGRLYAVGRRTREIVEAHHLTDIARVGGRFETTDAAPQLQWILLHVIQEYARHAGHLDIVRELTDGSVGEGG